MSFWDLPGFIALARDSRAFRAQRHRLYFNALLARPFLFARWCWSPRPSACACSAAAAPTLMIVGGVASGFLLYFLSDIVFALGLSATIPVTLAAWTPTGVSRILGATMLLHLEDG